MFHTRGICCQSGYSPMKDGVVQFNYTIYNWSVVQWVVFWTFWNQDESQHHLRQTATVCLGAGSCHCRFETHLYTITSLSDWLQTSWFANDEKGCKANSAAQDMFKYPISPERCTNLDSIVSIMKETLFRRQRCHWQLAGWHTGEKKNNQSLIRMLWLWPWCTVPRRGSRRYETLCCRIAETRGHSHHTNHHR